MCEPDLLVVVGSDENKKEYHHHSQVMATHSTYIDTMLATPMKESQSLTLNFPDLRPELWECMVKYLNPLHSRSLSIQMAMNLAPAYDKYSFDRSLKLCDQVLSEMFEKDGRTHGNHVKPLHDLDLLIDAFLLANDANLKDTMKHGVQYFHQTLHSNDRYGKIIFSERQIKKLVPLIVKENLLRHPRRPPFTFARTWSMDEIQSLCEYSFESKFIVPFEIALLPSLSFSSCGSVSRTLCSLEQKQGKCCSKPTGGGTETLAQWAQNGRDFLS